MMLVKIEQPEDLYLYNTLTDEEVQALHHFDNKDVLAIEDIKGTSEYFLQVEGLYRKLLRLNLVATVNNNYVITPSGRTALKLHNISKIVTTFVITVSIGLTGTRVTKVDAHVLDIKSNQEEVYGASLSGHMFDLEHICEDTVAVCDEQLQKIREINS